MDKFEKQFEQIVSGLNIDDRPNAEHKKTLRQQMLAGCKESTSGKTAIRIQPVWSRIMRSNITKSAAAAIIVIAGIFSLTFLNITVTKAYALEDTIKAYNSIRWLHINESYAFSSGEPRTSEIWIECDTQGNITKLRFQSDNVGEPIGPLVFAGDSESSEAWLPRHNLRLVGYGKVNPSVFLRYDISELDPKFLFERLYEQQNNGEAIVDIFEPAEAGEPIIVTVTYPQGTRSQMWKKVIYVEQETSLVLKIEKFEYRSQGFELLKSLEFSGYNQPIEQASFNLDNDVPAGTRVVDLSGMEAGLPQGNMTDKEAVERVTREFFQAAIEKDFYRAGQLYLAAPDFLVEQGFMGANVLKIISIGPAHRDPDPDSNVMNCSCKVLLEHSGQYYELDAFMVRLIRSNKGENRWLICGMGSSINPAYGMINISPAQNGLDDVTYDELMPGEFMKRWLVLGPLPYYVPDNTDPFSKEGQRKALDTDIIDTASFAPEVFFDNGDGETAFGWALLETNDNAIDLNQLDADKSDFQIAYLWAQVEMPEDRTVTLGIGSDDGVKVWVNGELIHENWLYRGVVTDNDRVQVTFKKGTNQLVLKVQNALGPWGFCCRMLDE